MMDVSNVYIDWPMVAHNIESVRINAYDKDGSLIGVIKTYTRPIEQTMARCDMELEVRRSYRMHPGRIRKFTDETLIDLLIGCGKKVAVKKFTTTQPKQKETGE